MGKQKRIFRYLISEYETYTTMRHLLACYILVKNLIFQSPFTDPDISSRLTCHSNFSVRNTVKEEIFLLKMSPFFALGHNMRCFGLFVPGSTQLLQHLLGIKISKLDKNILSCARLYVDLTYTLIYQVSERILVING